MLHEIRHCIASTLSATDRAAIDPGRFLCLDLSRGSNDGCCCLFLTPDGTEPVVVAKAARSARRQAAYRVELENLARLDASGLNRTRRSTPRPLGMIEEHGVLVTLQSALPGRLMRSLPARELFSRERAGTTVEGVLAWQRNFEGAFPLQRVTIDPALYAAEVSSLVRRIRERFVLERDEIEFLTRRFEHERRLLGLELPLVVSHGDFCVANLVVQDERIGAFDWEHALVPGLPLYDLFFFFASTRFPFRSWGRESSYAQSLIEVFWGESYLNRLLREQVQKSCAALVIPQAAVDDLFLLALLLRADRKFDNDDCERDAPLVSIRSGALLSLRHAVRHGLPALGLEPAQQ